MGQESQQPHAQYVFGQTSDSSEQRRLQALEAVFDPASVRRLQTCGALAGKRALEVGAGAGSIARWLTQQVGEAGHVIALDLNPRFLEREAGFEVVQGSLADATLPSKGFDLVHARYVLVHNSEPEPLIDTMLECLAPGGCLVLEEPDFGTARSLTGPSELRRHFDRVNAAILAMFTSRGLDPGFGARLASLLEQRQLQLELLEQVPHLERGSSPLACMMALSTEQLSDQYLATGRASFEDIEGYLAFARSEHCWGHYYTTQAIVARKPI